jgi:1-acyl-sn-glycerol-3-phosphate acyltransferase
MAISRSPQDRHAPAPRVSAVLRGGFGRYVRRYIRRHFNAVRLARGSAPTFPADHAVICFVNHPGWWDPLTAVLLHDLYFMPRTFYAPIDARALAAYPIFSKLGFYGIDLHSTAGSRNFLSVSRKLLRDAQAAIWMTPTGRFADVRERAAFQPGLAHLVAGSAKVSVLPLAIEYCFWEERTPELLVEFGPVVSVETLGPRRSKADWQQACEQAMADAQASLAHKAIARDYESFDALLDGRAGVGGWYEMLRRSAAAWRGKVFRPRHRTVHQEPLG